MISNPEKIIILKLAFQISLIVEIFFSSIIWLIKNILLFKTFILSNIDFDHSISDLSANYFFSQVEQEKPTITSAYLLKVSFCKIILIFIYFSILSFIMASFFLLISNKIELFCKFMICSLTLVLSFVM